MGEKTNFIYGFLRWAAYVVNRIIYILFVIPVEILSIDKVLFRQSISQKAMTGQDRRLDALKCKTHQTQHVAVNLI